MFRRAEAAIVRIEGVVLADSLAVASFVSPAGELRQFRFRAFGRHVRAACEASGCGDRGPGRSAALCPGSSSRRLSGKEARDVRESGGNRWSECLLKRDRGAEPWRSVGGVSGWRRGLDVYGRFCSGLSRLRLPVRSWLPEIRRDGNVVRESAASSRRTEPIARCGSSPFLRGNGFRVCRMAGTFCIRGHPFGHGSFRSEAEGVSFVGRVCDVREMPSRPRMPPVGKKCGGAARTGRTVERCVRSGGRETAPVPPTRRNRRRSLPARDMRSRRFSGCGGPVLRQRGCRTGFRNRKPPLPEFFRQG